MLILWEDFLHPPEGIPNVLSGYQMHLRLLLLPSLLLLHPEHQRILHTILNLYLFRTYM